MERELGTCVPTPVGAIQGEGKPDDVGWEGAEWGPQTQAGHGDLGGRLAWGWSRTKPPQLKAGLLVASVSLEK